MAIKYSKGLIMQIQMQDLYRIIPKKNIEISNLRGYGQLLSLVKRFYCNQLTMSGKCPLMCEACAHNLLEATSQQSTTSNGGLVVWKLRTLVQNMNTVEAKPEVARTEYGFASGINVWDQLLEEVDAEEVIL
jgi:hypothetical protein